MPISTVAALRQVSVSTRSAKMLGIALAGASLSPAPMSSTFGRSGGRFCGRVSSFAMAGFPLARGRSFGSCPPPRRMASGRALSDPRRGCYSSAVPRSARARPSGYLPRIFPRPLPMFDWLADPNAWIALATLTALEIVLGIDNIIFISILVGASARGAARPRAPARPRPRDGDAHRCCCCRSRGSCG